MASEAGPVCCLILIVETPARVRARRETGAYALARVAGRIDARSSDALAYDQAHGLGGQALAETRP